MNPLLHLEDYELILGSSSPRRFELFSGLGMTFRVIASDKDEIIPEGMDPSRVPEYLSKFKSDDIKESLNQDFLLVTADTIVVYKGEILGKPADKSNAKSMIRTLAGNTHSVITGVTICTQKQAVSFSEITQVGLSSMTDHEIDWYVEHYNVLDKAGAYGIQDWIGMTKVNNLSGSYYNVMGLPVDKVYDVLLKWL